MKKALTRTDPLPKSCNRCFTLLMPACTAFLERCNSCYKLLGCSHCVFGMVKQVFQDLATALTYAFSSVKAYASGYTTLDAYLGVQRQNVSSPTRLIFVHVGLLFAFHCRMTGWKRRSAVLKNWPEPMRFAHRRNPPYSLGSKR